MPQQHPSENPLMFPADTASFFKSFVGQQDEVPSVFRVIHQEKTMVLYHPAGSRPIIQTRASDSGLYCTSIFAPHELTPRKGTPQELPTGSPDWMIGMISLCLLLLIIARVFFQRRFGQIFNAFIRPRNLSILIREGNILKERITPPLILLHMLSFSLFFYLIINAMFPGEAFSPGGLRLFLMISGAYALFYGLRFLAVQILGWIFATREPTTAYLVNSLVMDEVLGVFLLPVCLILLVSNQPAGGAFMLIALIIFALVLLYRFIRNFLVGLSNLKFSWLYLFLYLCTVEILPVLAFGKLINDWLSA